MSPEEAVKLSIRMISENPDDSDDTLVTRIADHDLGRDIASLLFALVPLAFSRAYFESFPMTKEYAEDYIVFDQATGRETSHEIESDPYFIAASNAAKEIVDADSLVPVASRSGEFEAINNVLVGLPEGSTPTRIGTSPPYVLYGEPRLKPWWNFWGN